MNGSLDGCFQQLSNAPNRFLFFEIKKSYDRNGGGGRGQARREREHSSQNDDKNEAAVCVFLDTCGVARR